MPNIDLEVGEIAQDVAEQVADIVATAKTEQLLQESAEAEEGRVAAEQGRVSAEEARATEFAGFEEEIESKITRGAGERDGTLKVGYADNADQLNSPDVTVDQAPYLYRTSGGDADIGNREKDTIVGGSLGWNQPIQDGNFPNDSKWKGYGSEVTLSVSNNVAHVVFNQAVTSPSYLYSIRTKNDSYGCQIIAGHKYLLLVDVISTKTTKIGFEVFQSYPINNYVLEANVKSTIARIVNAPVSRISQMLIGPRSGTFEVGDYYEVSNYWMTDLTADFGPEIADYIYSLETATAGAGVAWFRKLFPKPYYPYKAIGGFLHVKLTSHDMVGFNQFDKNGNFVTYYITNGVYTDSVMTRGLWFKCIPNTTYHFKKTLGSRFAAAGASDIFTSDGQKFNTVSDTITVNEFLFTTGPNDNYIYVWFYNESVDAGLSAQQIANTVVVNLSWSGWRNGQYEAYKKNSYPLDTSVILRGIPKLDADNNLYYDGDKYHNDGTVDEEFEEHTFTGDEEIIGFGTLDGNCRFQLYLDSVANTATSDLPTNITSSNADIISPETWYARTKSGFTIGVSGYGTVGKVECAIVGVSTVEDAKIWLTGKTIVFKKATPTTSSATPFQETQEVDDFGTEEYVVPEQDGVAVPVGHYTEYPENLRDKLRRLPNMPTVSESTTATYAVNYNGQTKKCSFVPINDWLVANGYPTANVLASKEALGGTLRQLLVMKTENLAFNDTDCKDLTEFTFIVVNGGASGTYIAQNVSTIFKNNNLISTLYENIGVQDYTAMADKTIQYRVNYNALYIRDTSCATPADVVAKIKGHLIAYEKASS